MTSVPEYGRLHNHPRPVKRENSASKSAGNPLGYVGSGWGDTTPASSQCPMVVSFPLERSVEAIDDAAMPKEEEESENFYEFYARFVGDSVFQAERVSTPLPFVTLDPEDEFQVLETTLNERQWFAFQPTLSKEYLTNVNYGQGLDNRSKTRIVELKGFGNGFYNTLHFRRKNGVWMLVRFEDLGD